MKIKIILLFVVCFIFALTANAQLCGQYKTSLTIENPNGEAITDAVVKITPLQKDELKGITFVREGKDSSTFSITFSEGHAIPSKYKLTVSAKDFKTFETEMEFPYCTTRSYVLTLADKKSASENIFEPERKYIFTVADKNQRQIQGVKITIFWEDGKVSEAVTEENKPTVINFLGEKKGTARIEKGGFQTREIVLDSRKDSFNMRSEDYIDVTLKENTP